jgi:hypothetical protein
MPAPAMTVSTAAALLLAVARWIGYPTPGIPRLPNGKPNLIEAMCENEKDLVHMVGK